LKNPTVRHRDRHVILRIARNDLEKIMDHHSGQ
jgi:hypothetical protein